MKKLVFVYLLLPLIILTSCTSNNTAPTATPTKATASSVPTATASPMKTPTSTQTPISTVKPRVKQDFKLPNEAANVYMKIIDSALSTQSNYKELFLQDDLEQMYSGASFDLDSDGQDELIMAYRTDNGKYYSYEIYTYKSGDTIPIKRDKLFSNAGGPEGGLSLVNYNGVKYLCVWDRNSNGGDTSTFIKYNYELFTYKDAQLISEHKFNFTYQWARGKTFPLDDRPGLFKDGKEISFDEFIKTQDAFESPVKVLCKVGKSEPPYRLRQLYEDIKNR